MGADEALVILSQEQYEHEVDQRRVGVPLSSPASRKTPDSPAVNAWSTVKFTSKDKKRRTIPTRTGNSLLGWRHFSNKHNITRPHVIKTIVQNTQNPGKDKDRPHRLVYDGVLASKPGPLDPPRKLASIRIIVQYHWQTDDGKHSLANHHDKVGVITAYCRNVARNRCPDKVNEA
ncbi:hypothetical protein [Streptomyces sp. NPDC095613]|uniref:hypothetical protein n=1 Tax=Streptomyces sp. NPDC095613 TaxID=3155540 RepID=UPI0033261DC1